MNNGITISVDIVIQAPVTAIWKALTDPDMIKQYLFGTNVHTDWQEGSPITYTGVWQGKTYEDKGIIVKVIPNELLQSTYWSSMGGRPDTPDNYSTVTYELEAAGKGTKLTLIQDNNPTKEAADHSQSNWTMVLGSLKKLVEQPK